MYVYIYIDFKIFIFPFIYCMAQIPGVPGRVDFRPGAWCNLGNITYWDGTKRLGSDETGGFDMLHGWLVGGLEHF